MRIAPAIEATRKHHGFAGDLDQLVMRRRDTGVVSESQRDLFPGFYAVVVGLLRELCDGQVSVLVDDRCFRSRAAE
jgi:hypothetical protein